MKKKLLARVQSQQSIGPEIYDMWLETELAGEAAPGQFVCLYPKDRSTLLPRPISICQVSEDKKALRLVYRLAGQGTREFAGYGAGETAAVLGNLGNGFPLEAGRNKKAFLMGGGIGIPPLLELAGRLEADITSVLGYRDSHLFLAEEFAPYGEVWAATEDGSVGTKGNVMDVLREKNASPDIIYACGPMPMLRAIKAYAEEKDIPAYISLEEHMACGVGACLGCVVKTKEADHHSFVHNARICTEGPVFLASDIA